MMVRFSNQKRKGMKSYLHAGKLNDLLYITTKWVSLKKKVTFSSDFLPENSFNCWRTNRNKKSQKKIIIENSPSLDLQANAWNNSSKKCLLLLFFEKEMAVREKRTYQAPIQIKVSTDKGVNYLSTPIWLLLLIFLCCQTAIVQERGAIVIFRGRILSNK